MNKLFLNETFQSTPLMAESDVLVCGGGPAGVAAAVSAARAGAKTRLLELQGCLGGVWTAGLLSIVLDARGKAGFQPELIERLAEASRERTRYFHLAGSGQTPDFLYDPEIMKWVLEEMCQEAGVEIQLHTRVVSTVIQEKRMSAVVTESKSGRQAWPARIFIDATGDGDLAALAGCQYDYGRAQNAETSSQGKFQTQPMSLVALVGGLDPDEVAEFTNGHPAFVSPGHSDLETKRALAVELTRAGAPPSYTLPVLFHLREGLFAFCANHEYGYSGLDAAQLTQASLHARAEVHQQIRALRKLGGPWKNMLIVATPSHIGVREGRRIHGRYQVTVNDLLEGRSQPDAVCRVNFPVDVHSPDPQKSTAYGEEGVRSRPYDIPLRALIARDIEGLMMAGRCISGDFLAHASYRVTGNAMSMGQAAGVTSALAARQNKLPHEVEFGQIQETRRRLYH